MCAGAALHAGHASVTSHGHSRCTVLSGTGLLTGRGGPQHKRRQVQAQTELCTRQRPRALGMQCLDSHSSCTRAVPLVSSQATGST